MKVFPETSQTTIEYMKSAVHLDRKHVWSAAVWWRKHFSQDTTNWDPSNQQDNSLKNYGICNHKNLDKWFTKFQKLMDSSNVILMVFGETTTHPFGSQSVPLERHLMFGTPGQWKLLRRYKLTETCPQGATSRSWTHMKESGLLSSSCSDKYNNGGNSPHHHHNHILQRI